MLLNVFFFLDGCKGEKSPRHAFQWFDTIVLFSYTGKRYVGWLPCSRIQIRVPLWDSHFNKIFSLPDPKRTPVSEICEHPSVWYVELNLKLKFETEIEFIEFKLYAQNYVIPDDNSIEFQNN